MLNLNNRIPWHVSEAWSICFCNANICFFDISAFPYATSNCDCGIEPGMKDGKNCSWHVGLDRASWNKAVRIRLFFSMDKNLSISPACNTLTSYGNKQMGDFSRKEWRHLQVTVALERFLKNRLKSSNLRLSLTALFTVCYSQNTRKIQPRRGNCIIISFLKDIHRD